jgi:hypothetical protein
VKNPLALRGILAYPHTASGPGDFYSVRTADSANDFAATSATSQSTSMRNNQPMDRTPSSRTRQKSGRHSRTIIGIITALCAGAALAMGDAPDPDAPTSACLQGEAVQDSGLISQCRWANANTGMNSVRFTIHPDKPHARYHKGEIITAYFSTGVSLCDGQSDTTCGGRPQEITGQIIGNGATFNFKAGSDAFMEAKIKAYQINGVTHFGLDSCVCR